MQVSSVFKKLMVKGKFKMENFNIFESIRDKSSGGSLLGVHCSLNPKLISEYSSEFELLVVETDIGGKGSLQKKKR